MTTNGEKTKANGHRHRREAGGHAAEPESAGADVDGPQRLEITEQAVVRRLFENAHLSDSSLSQSVAVSPCWYSIGTHALLRQKAWNGAKRVAAF